MIKCFCHIIGKFNIKLGTLCECPAKWLDRDLDEKGVEDISRSVESNPAIIHNGQPWLAIADVTKEDVTNDKSIIKGAKLELVGGLHRHAALKKVRITIIEQCRSMQIQAGSLPSTS